MAGLTPLPPVRDSDPGAPLGECPKYLLLLPKPGQDGLGRPLNIVLLSDETKEWHKQPQIGGFPKGFKPFGHESPPLIIVFW